MRSKLALRDVDLNLLVLFDALMDTRHLTRAARRLGMTQSAASQALGRLRTALDDELFIRARGGMTPTPVAEELARFISPGLGMMQEALDRTGPFEPETTERTFRLSFGSTHEVELFPPIVAVVARACPKAKLVSLPGSAESALARVLRAGLDLFFDYAPPRDERLRFRRWRNEELVVIARKSHPRIASELSTRDFFREAHVVLAVADARRAIVERVVQRGGERRRVIAEVSDYASVLPIVQSTDALAIVPRSMVESGSASRRLKVLAPPMRLPSLSVHAIWHVALETDGGHRWLREALP